MTTSKLLLDMLPSWRFRRLFGFMKMQILCSWLLERINSKQIFFGKNYKNFKTDINYSWMENIVSKLCILRNIYIRRRLAQNVEIIMAMNWSLSKNIYCFSSRVIPAQELITIRNTISREIHFWKHTPTEIPTFIMIWTFTRRK